jgi:hypothetical protein
MYTYTALSNTVGRFKTSQYHPTSVQISWEAVQEDIVIGYVVQVDGPTSTRKIPIPNKYRTFIRLSYLSPSTQYTFEVSAVNGMDKVHLTHPTKIVTDDTCIHTSGGAPRELKVSHSLPTSALLSWAPIPEDKRNDTITGYTVWVEGPDSTRKIPVMDGNATSFEVSGLKPHTTYTFSVSAITKIGTGLAKHVSSTTPQGGEVLYLHV